MEKTNIRSVRIMILALDYSQVNGILSILRNSFVAVLIVVVVVYAIYSNKTLSYINTSLDGCTYPR